MSDPTYSQHEEQLFSDDDVALAPSGSADSAEEVANYVSAEVRGRYDVYSYRHAAAILGTAYPDALADIEAALLNFSITTSDIARPGGNESTIPKLFSATLRPAGWTEARIQADLVVRIFEKAGLEIAAGTPQTEQERAPVVLQNYIDGHKIDYVKDRVALDLEWNSKDQTFDRDLYAFRAFYDCGVTSVGVLVTRSEKLNKVFDTLPLLKKDGTPDLTSTGAAKLCKQKYGASTTWMGKLLYRLNAGRHGGCPVLVFGITPDAVSDWTPEAQR